MWPPEARMAMQNRDRVNQKADIRTMAINESAIDLAAIGKLAKALAFISGAAHPVTLALQKASETKADADVKKARQLFLQMPPSLRASALAFLND
jgi:hypothetical protein